MENINVCYWCEEKTEKLFETADEYLICKNCWEDQTKTCPCCGHTYLFEDFVSVSGEYVCKNCAQNAVECNFCGELFWEENMTETQDGLVCSYCVDGYINCDCCEELVYSNYLTTTEDDYCLCSYCWEYETCTDDEGNVYLHEENIPEKLIKGYSYKPFPKFYGVSENYYTPIFFGVELEIGKILDGYSPDEMASELQEELGDFVYFKEDGSLRYGFEIVTHPATIDYFKSSQIFEKIEKTLLHKARAFNKGGMHIHISRKAFKDDNHLGRFVFFLNYHRKFCEIIAQRNSNRWAAWYNDEVIPDPFTPVRLTQTYNLSGDRYKAINLENKYTIEVRVFNANIYANRNLKNIEFLDAVLKFTAEEKNYKLDEFLDFIQKPEYVNLINFLEDRKEKWKSLEYSYSFECNTDIIKSDNDWFEIFIEFLKKEGVYDKFLENLRENITLLQGDPKDAYIMRAFVWSSTPEGETFWNNINTKWRNILNK